MAATIRSGSSLVVTFNLKDFPKEALQEWAIEALHPEDYLLLLYEMEPLQVVQRLAEMAGRKGETQLDTLTELGKSCAKFASRLIDDLDLL